MPASVVHDSRQSSRLNQRRALDLPYRLVGCISLFFLVLLLCWFLPKLANKGISTELANRDFVNYWTAAHLAVEGRVADIFGPQPRYFAHLTELMGPDFPWHNWSYPPHYLLLMMPLALAGYKLGMVLFLLVTGLFFLTGLTAFMGRWDRLAIVAVSPLIATNIFMVQNGFLTSGLALWFLTLRDRRPIVAGICLGMLTIKPQLALLLPIIPLLERRWMLLLTAGLTTVGLVLLSALAFGMDSWIGFFREILPYQAKVMALLEGSWLTMVPSLFGGMRLLGWSATTALWVHMIVAVPMLVLTLLCLMAGHSGRLPDVLLPISMFVVLPYALNYDFGTAGAALALFIRREEALGRPFTVGEQMLLASAMLLPLVMIGIGVSGLDIGPIVLLGVLALVVRRTGALRELRDQLPRWLQYLSKLRGRLLYKAY
jgi:hypothetical protein